MAQNLARKIISSHLQSGEMRPGAEIGIRIDQTLTQDATGTLVMLELDAMRLDRAMTELSAQYVDHNLVQADSKNADDHRFLQSACRRFGLWFSPPGNGVSHPVHQERFGKPGKTLLGSDSHTPAAGALGMLAIGAGGLDVAMAIAGEPFYFTMPEIWHVHLEGELSPWVSAKDVILELLRRHGVSGGVNRVVEYSGPGVDALSVWDRHVIANMGTELGATSTVFPADERVRAFLRSRGRQEHWCSLQADAGADYDVEERLDLSKVEPLIALPSSPGNVRRVRDVAGKPIYQAYIGSSANPGYRDFAIAAAMVADKEIDPRVSFDLNPASRVVLQQLIQTGALQQLIASGGRLHQVGCNGCIGMGQAPASGQISLRTVPRNFPGRSGAVEDQVYLVSPETAAASALRGVITDPRDLALPYPEIAEPSNGASPSDGHFVAPLPPDQARQVELQMGPNIVPLPQFDPLPDVLELPVLLSVGDDISTDEIMPAGAQVLPLRSNIPAISEYVFRPVDAEYVARAGEHKESGHAILAGRNYGQGSSREHAALAPRYLGLRAVLAQSFARIHGQNLCNMGVLPLRLADDGAHERIERDDRIRLEGLQAALKQGDPVQVRNLTRETTTEARHDLSGRQVEVLLEGGLINWMRRRRGCQSCS